MKKILITSLFALFANTALAGNAYIIQSSGTPFSWDNSASIALHTETGVCGNLSNIQMRARVLDSINEWDDLTEADIDFQIVTGVVNQDVTGANFEDFISDTSNPNSDNLINDGINPIVFDDDGEIIDSIAGANNSFFILGFANPDGFNTSTGEIVGGQAVINCRCLEDRGDLASNDCDTQGVTFSNADNRFTVTHEIGHFLNLDHSQVNSDLVTSNENNPDHEDVPTMYPQSIGAALQLTPTQDDIMSISSLYPSSGFLTSRCIITGSLLDSEGLPLRCADVQAVAADPSKTVSFISGAYAPNNDANSDGDSADSGECLSGCGDFQIYLEPGVDYTLVVKPINPSFINGSGISPCTRQITSIEEEVLGTIDGSSCVGGETNDVGEVTASLSTGGVTTGTTGGGASAGGCNLNSSSQNFANVFGLLFGLFALLILKTRLHQKG